MTDTSGYMELIHECNVCRGRFSDEELLRTHVCPAKPGNEFIELAAEPKMINDTNELSALWGFTEDLEPATEIGPGVTLRTKDGRKIGNGIVVMEMATAHSDRVWLVETDFGNQVRLSAEEIDTLWWLGWKQPYEQWLGSRRMKIDEGA